MSEFSKIFALLFIKLHSLFPFKKFLNNFSSVSPDNRYVGRFISLSAVDRRDQPQHSCKLVTENRYQRRCCENFPQQKMNFEVTFKYKVLFSQIYLHLTKLSKAFLNLNYCQSSQRKDVARNFAPSSTHLQLLIPGFTPGSFFNLEIYFEFF